MVGRATWAMVGVGVGGIPIPRAEEGSAVELTLGVVVLTTVEGMVGKRGFEVGWTLPDVLDGAAVVDVEEGVEWWVVGFGVEAEEAVFFLCDVVVFPLVVEVVW